MSLEKLNLINDIYYSDDYVNSYLKEDEELFTFHYKEENNYFINKTIKRPILKIGNIPIDEGYFDLESAYGYGGYLVNTDDNLFLQRAMKVYEKKCRDEKIIAEFIRFHPFNSFPKRQQDFLDFNIHDRDVIIVNLQQDILSSYPSKIRNTIKRATEKVHITMSHDLDKFIDIYTTTMQKNSAADFYFFDKAYFENILSLNNVELYEVVFKDNIIAMGFFMHGSIICHYHLSANTDTSYQVNANYALLNHMFHVAQTAGQQFFLLGGGTTSATDDPLYKFKKKFSKDLLPFFIAGNIFDKNIYNKYNNMWQEQQTEKVRYFLKYRLEIK